MTTVQTLRPESIHIDFIKTRPEKIIINEEYQRSVTWKQRRQQELLESILGKLSIGIFVVRKIDNKLEILDGQQRIETIKKFLNNEIKTSEQSKYYRNKFFRELNPTTQKEFETFRIWYIPVICDSINDLADYFLKLQRGQPLNTPEKLNAIQSNIKKFVIEISKNNFFKLSVKNKESFKCLIKNIRIK